jgi:hypothetical protein
MSAWPSFIPYCNFLSHSDLRLPLKCQSIFFAFSERLSANATLKTGKGKDMCCLTVEVEMETHDFSEQAGPVRGEGMRTNFEGFMERTLCAWCGRMRDSRGVWGNASSIKALEQATHGICPECIASEMCAEPGQSRDQPRLER